MLRLMPRQTDDRSLKDTFSKFGNVSDCFIPKDRETGKAKGFGFVTFEDKRDADEAVAELNGFALVCLRRLLSPASQQGH